MSSVDKPNPRRERRSGLLPTVPRDRLAQANYAAEIQSEDASEAGYLGFTARVFAMTCLPYRDPLVANPALPAWTRRNGNMLLSVEPALTVDPDTGEQTRRMPFGKYPRLVLPWLTTQIVRNQAERDSDGTMQIDFTASLPKFLADLGATWGGKSGKLLIEQVPRLLGARISVTELGSTGGGQGVRSSGFQVADGYELWWGNDEHLSNDGLWGNTVTLSSRFVQDVLDAPIPIDLRSVALMAKHGPMAMDMLSWLNYRLPAAKRPSTVTWDQLHMQFGAQYDRLRDFKAAFVGKLPAVRTVYPDARFEVEDGGLRLFPSPPAIQRKSIT